MSDEASVLEAAARRPADVQARIDAAYHCDAHRTEEEAIVHYDAAWKLGVPAAHRKQFMLGYGSTLKNVNRLQESESILRLAIDENPEDSALVVFLALTLHRSDKSDAAVAMLLQVLLDLGTAASNIHAYRRALDFYAKELRA